MAMTKSKTKLVRLDRKTSVSKSVIKKAVQKAFAGKGEKSGSKPVLRKAS